MSGIEIIIIVGAGYYITKKVREHKQAKREQQALLEHGPAQESTAASGALQQRQQVPTEEEPLPLYSGPSKDLVQTYQPQGSYNPHLPTYDEVRDEKQQQQPNEQNPFTDPVATPPQPESKRKSLKSKLWKRDHTQTA